MDTNIHVHTQAHTSDNGQALSQRKMSNCIGKEAITLNDTDTRCDIASAISPLHLEEPMTCWRVVKPFSCLLLASEVMQPAQSYNGEIKANGFLSLTPLFLLVFLLPSAKFMSLAFTYPVA